ncbi:MAG: hypothetical protein RL660_1750 [Bacteroidota bacterium]|jgi:hypothetical protein
MKYIAILTVTILLTFTKESHSQINAGVIPAGSMPIVLNANLSNYTYFTHDSVQIDLNNDLVKDVQFELYQGPTIIDAANYIRIKNLGASIKFCDTTIFGKPYTKLYSYGDLMTCFMQTNWGSFNQDFVADYGCMDCVGPGKDSNKYLGFLDTITNIQGWLKIKFNITGSGNMANPITLTIDTLLPNMIPSSLSNTENEEIKIFPTPLGKTFYINSSNINEVRLYNFSGQELELAKINNNEFELKNEYIGMAFIMMKYKEKTVWNKVMIYN